MSTLLDFVLFLFFFFYENFQMGVSLFSQRLRSQRSSVKKKRYIKKNTRTKQKDNFVDIRTGFSQGNKFE